MGQYEETEKQYLFSLEADQNNVAVHSEIASSSVKEEMVLS